MSEQLSLLDLATASPGLPDGIPTEVGEMYEKFALDLIVAGWTRYSSDAILHRVRWHYHVDKANRDFKCNDHWTSRLSRWFMAKYPKHKGFFETREKRNPRPTEEDEA